MQTSMQTKKCTWNNPVFVIRRLFHFFRQTHFLNGSSTWPMRCDCSSITLLALVLLWLLLYLHSLTSTNRIKSATSMTISKFRNKLNNAGDRMPPWRTAVDIHQAYYSTLNDQLMSPQRTSSANVLTMFCLMSYNSRTLFLKSRHARTFARKCVDLLTLI